MDKYEESAQEGYRRAQSVSTAPLSTAPIRPTRATTLPVDGAMRKTFPMASGLLFYFPDALAAVSNLSYTGNQQHNPGQPLNWDRSKSQDEADTLLRHLAQSGTVDTDGIRHSTKVAWRALALLQKEIEAANQTKAQR